jgi:carboxypeptidase T
MRLCLAFALALVCALSSTVADAREVVRISAPDAATRQQLGLLFGHVLIDPASGDALVESDALARSRLDALAIAWQVDPPATQALTRELSALAGDPRAIAGFACYRSVEETMAAIDAMVAARPDLASYVDIGVSWRRTQNANEGWPLRVLRLGNSAVAGDKPKLFAMSAVHAREYTTAEVMTRFAEQLVAGHGVDPEATWLLDHNEFHLLLQANPDGRKRAETGILWRKNENTASGPCPTNPPTSNSHPGIDLNRNFPLGWNTTPFGSSGTACSATFRGPAPASEPETQAIRDYVLTLFPDTRPGSAGDLTTPADPDTRGLFLDVHSYSKLVLWPWGTTDQVTGNDAALARLGKRLAWFGGYAPQQAIELYATDGTTIDFAYGELGVPAFTLELGIAFFESCTQAEATTIPENLATLRYAARTLQAPYRLPAGPEALAAAAEPDLIASDQTVTVSARLDDGRYQSPGPESPSHAIAGADVVVGGLPWDAGAARIAMAASDGAFDSSAEDANVQIHGNQLPTGRQLLYVQGTDAATETGPPAAVFVGVYPADQIGTVAGRVSAAATGIGLAASVRSDSGFSSQTEADGSYLRRLPAGGDGLTFSAPGYLDEVRPVTVAGTQMQTLDVALHPRCVLLADDAEAGNVQDWTAQVPWGIAAVAGNASLAWTDSPGGNYANNANTSLVSRPLPAADYADLRLAFRHRCDTQANADYGLVEYSTTGGASWTEAFRCSGGGSAWRSDSVELPGAAADDDLRLRFRLLAGPSSTRDGWSLDDIELSAGGPACRAGSDTLFRNGFEG